MEPRSTCNLLRRSVPLLLLALTLGCTLDDTSRYLVMIAALFLLGAAGDVIFARTQVPDAVWLILAGVTLNVTGAVDPAVLDPILPLFSALTLIIVLFDGGRQIVINELLTVAPRASAMALLGFVFAMFAVAIIVHLAALTGLLPDTWTFTHSLMVGAILGGSSSMIVMPSMALAKVEPKVSNLVGLESALTDALCVVVAVVLMNVLAGSGDGNTMLALGKSFGLAVLVGLIAGWIWMPVLRWLSGNPYAYPITLAALLILYVTVDQLGGNPAMAVLTFSVIAGNADSLMKRIGFSLGDKPLQLDDTVVTVHTQATFFVKSFFFTYIGLMLSPPWSLIIVGVLVGVSLFLTRVPVALMVAGQSGGFDDKQRKMITISLPRGMAAGVLAILPSSAKYAIPGTEQLPALVFAAVVTSILIFTYGFRQVRPVMKKVIAPDVAVAMPDGSLPAPEIQVGRADTPALKAAPSEPPPLIVPADLMPNAQPMQPSSDDPKSG